MRIRVNNIELAYEVTGAGRPLLLLHGNGESRQIFDVAAARLSQRFTCYLLDSRGHGESEPVREYHYTDMAADVVAFLEALDLRDVGLVGFSDGAILGMIAAPQTDRITEMILCGGNTRPSGMRPLVRYQLWRMNVFIHNPRIDLMNREPDISDADLGRITARTLVVAGKRDMIKRKETEHIAACIPGAELRILEGETHESYVTHSERIAEIVEEFFTGAV